MSPAPSSFHNIALPAGRVRLRPLDGSDGPAIYRIFSDAEVMRYWSRPAMTDMVQADDYICLIRDGYADGSLLQLGVERAVDQTLIGTCTLFRFDWSNRRAEIGYALGRAHWGQGFMGEALGALLHYAFDQLDLHRLEADIDPRNEQSAKSLLRMGFTLEGVLRERWIVNGEVSDTGYYGLLQREWREQTNRPGQAR